MSGRNISRHTHKKAKIWRKKPFPLYDSIQILVEGIVATGESVFRVGMAAVTDAINTLDNPTDSGEENREETRMSDDSSTTDEDADGSETPIKRNNRKRPAAEMTPLVSLTSRKRPTSRSIRRSANGRDSGTDAMFLVAGAIEALADTFDQSGGVTSLECRRAAIRRLEEDDELSETEQVAAVRLFSRQTTIANSYLAIKKKSTRTRYIQSELADF
ncbi:hypothetical protein AZE42_05264 [Rhizopogon vesiculosus]|uniref:Uncharacterized protein n=1 Tax=Rhizopogon vesiculosus TaxID=180088 RepID=A0A1J8Q2C7_9AGAM|nr:hypothetical protein AZE42_05264 [Rhizopogon vesiculosus]